MARYVPLGAHKGPVGAAEGISREAAFSRLVRGASARFGLLGEERRKRGVAA